MSAYKFTNFPQDNNLWRIDCLGQISRNTNIYTSPQVNVHLSPIINKAIYLDNPLSQKAVDSTQQIYRPVGVGFLELLQIGSSWKNGLFHQNVSQIKVPPETLNLDISNDSVQLVKANSVIKNFDETNSTWLLSKQYITLNSALETYLVAIKHDNDPFKILIPVIELIRFYYTFSSRMSLMIFNGAFDDFNNIVNEDKCGIHIYNNQKYLELKLRKELKDEDGWIIGRILTSKIARRESLAVHNSLKIASINNNPLCPEASFPFTGETSLKFQSKNIKTFDGRWHKFVTRIISCSHSLGFDYLSIDRDNNSARSDNGTPYEDRTPISFPAKKNITKKSIINITQDSEPDINLEKEILILPEKRFSSIKTEIIHPEKEACHYRSAQKKLLFPRHCNTTSSGDGKSNNTNISEFNIDITNRLNLSMPPDFSTLLEVLNKITQKRHLTYDLVEIKGHHSHKLMDLYPGASTFPIKDRNRTIKWSYLDSECKIPRQALLIRIVYKSKILYLLEIEVRPDKKQDHYSQYLFRNLNATNISEHELFCILLNFTKYKRSQFNLNTVFSRFNYTRLNHRSTNTEQLETNIIEKLNILCNTIKFSKTS